MIYHPIHPGRFLKETVFNTLNLDINQSAKCLGISFSSLSCVLNGRAAICPELAMKLEKAGISKATFWTTMQTKYDLWKAPKEKLDFE